MSQISKRIYKQFIGDYMKDEKYYLYHGGYLKCGDKYAKDGDNIRFQLTGNGNWIYGKLYFNNTDGNFLVQDYQKVDNPYYLWEIVAWELYEGLWICDRQSTEGKYYISINPEETFIDEDTIAYLGISEEKFYQIARKNNAGCYHHIIEYSLGDKKDAYDTFFTRYKDVENFRKDLEEAMNE